MKPEVLPQVMDLKHTTCEGTICVSQLNSYGIPYGTLMRITYNDNYNMAIISPYYSDHSYIFVIKNTFLIKRSVKYELRNETLYLI